MNERCHNRRRTRERGVITAMFAVLAVFLFLVISVVAEGGRKLGNLSRAEDLAAEAARSAAATLDLNQLPNGLALIDEFESRARLSADKIVDPIPDATIVSFTVEGDRVTVKVRVSAQSYIPGLDIDGVGSHQAVAYSPFG